MRNDRAIVLEYVLVRRFEKKSAEKRAKSEQEKKREKEREREKECNEGENERVKWVEKERV